MATLTRSDAGPQFPARLIDPAVLVAFAALSFLAMGAHELTHHVAGHLVCGEWGEMRLSQFSLPSACLTDGRPWWIATLAGPALTYGLIAVGAAWRSRWGLLLVFANLPLARLATVVGGGGDELLVARMALGSMAWPATILICLALLALPMWATWRRLPERHRAAIFAILLLVPLAWDFVFKRLFLGPLLPDHPTFAGVPVPILACDAIALIVLLAAGRVMPPHRRPG
jgi:hypothetical protein